MLAYFHGPEPMGCAVSSSLLIDAGATLMSARRSLKAGNGYLRLNVTSWSVFASTESMKLIMGEYRPPSLLERSYDFTTSFAVTGFPSENFAPSRNTTVYSVSETLTGSPLASALYIE